MGRQKHLSIVEFVRSDTSVLCRNGFYTDLSNASPWSTGNASVRCHYSMRLLRPLFIDNGTHVSYIILQLHLPFWPVPLNPDTLAP